VTAVPLSPHEESVLADLAADLRADDPAFADALGSGPQGLPPRPPLLRPRHVLGPAAALAGLAVVGALAADDLGPVGLAALTAVATVPWLVGAVRSRRPDPAPARTRRRRRPGTTPVRTVLLGAVPALAAVAVLPPAWQAAVGLTLVFGLLPVLALLVLRRSERRGR
jgi:hypothetical protein